MGKKRRLLSNNKYNGKYSSHPIAKLKEANAETAVECTEEPIEVAPPLEIVEIEEKIEVKPKTTSKPKTIKKPRRPRRKKATKKVTQAAT